ncbi:MAG: Smr/MutS family protein, partial [Rhodospirillales bacterium]|nr:Smr/MutS family protein [Rhodospirillales bacterium]
APGVDKRTGEKLRKGRMDIDGRVDLHGMSQEIAHGALIHLVGRGFDRGLRCLLVITGKGDRTGGEGVLRRAVPRWLNEPGLREKVLSFSYAQPRDGGEGALYVLLKRRR